MSALAAHDAPSSPPAWRLYQREVIVRGEPRRLRLVRFHGGWLASVDADSGPTLAADRSPHLAAWRALEPLGVELGDAIVAVGRLP